MANENDELAPDLRALFENYPRPTANADFDARFWRELDARRNRYRGFIGFARRIVEIEIEGVAVWRLGMSLFGGAAVCGLGVALLSLGGVPASNNPSQIAAMGEMLPPRLARVWDEDAWYFPPRASIIPPKAVEPKVVPEEAISCVSFVHGLA